MTKPVEGIRRSVISQETMERFKEYLRFCHLFRHIYGFELKWERFKTVAISMNNVLNALKNEIEKFLK